MFARSVTPHLHSGSHTGPGEVLVIPEVGSRNQSGGLCRCRDESSLCLALQEDVSQVICYCQQGHLVDINQPCSDGDNQPDNNCSLIFTLLRPSCDNSDTPGHWLHSGSCDHWSALHVPL